MPNTVHFVQFVANANKSVFSYELSDGFQFTYLEKKLAKHIVEQDKEQRNHSDYFWTRALCEHSVCIRRDYEVPGVKFYPVTNQRIELLRLYIHLRLLRLFGNGNLEPLNQYEISNIGGTLSIGHSQDKTHLTSYIDREPFTTSQSSFAQIQKSINKVLQRHTKKSSENTEKALTVASSSPFGNETYDLAFANFELSFKVEHTGLAFLTLITSMEILFEAGAQKVARNAAVLLSTDKEEGRKLYDEIRELHEKRSRYVHSGRGDIINREDLLALRSICRRCIVKYWQSGLSKKQVLTKLNESGFGEWNYK